MIGKDYQLVNVFTKKGRLVSGIVVEETDRAVTLQTLTERVVLAKADIEERQVSPVSMMPEGQLEKLTPTELRDLVGYLASKKQVPLPKAPAPPPKRSPSVSLAPGPHVEEAGRRRAA